MNPSIEGSTSPAMPSRSGLFRHLGIAFLTAGVILAVFILPAEFGIDPTGLGERMGLLELSTASAAVQVEDIPMAPPETARFYPAPVKSNVIEIPLDIDGELEYKVRMKAGDTVVYSWTVDNGAVYYDFHAESEPDHATLRYKEEQEGASEGHGSLVAPFDGIHGWYWLNLEDHPITITLRVSGFYELRPRDEQDIGVVQE